MSSHLSQTVLNGTTYNTSSLAVLVQTTPVTVSIANMPLDYSVLELLVEPSASSTVGRVHYSWVGAASVTSYGTITTTATASSPCVDSLNVRYIKKEANTIYFLSDSATGYIVRLTGMMPKQ